MKKIIIISLSLIGILGTLLLCQENTVSEPIDYKASFEKLQAELKKTKAALKKKSEPYKGSFEFEYSRWPNGGWTPSFKSFNDEGDKLVEMAEELIAAKKSIGWYSSVLDYRKLSEGGINATVAIRKQYSPSLSLGVISGYLTTRGWLNFYVLKPDFGTASSWIRNETSMKVSVIPVLFDILFQKNTKVGNFGLGGGCGIYLTNMERSNYFSHVENYVEIDSLDENYTYTYRGTGYGTHLSLKANLLLSSAFSIGVGVKYIFGKVEELKDEERGEFLKNTTDSKNIPLELDGFLMGVNAMIYYW